MDGNQNEEHVQGYSTPTSSPDANAPQANDMPPRQEPKQSSKAFIPGTHTKIDTLPQENKEKEQQKPQKGYGQPPAQNVHFGNQPQHQAQQPQPSKTSRFSFSAKTIFISLFIVSIIGTGAYIYSKRNPKIMEKNGIAETSPVDVKIENGNVVVDDQVVIDKNDYPDTGIAGFMHADSSTDGDHICFESWPPSLNPTLYIANDSGFEVLAIGVDFRNCTWIDGSRLVFEKRPVGITAADLFIYNLEDETQTNLTQGKAEEGFTRQYKIMGLSEDRQTLECEFNEVSIINGSKATGKCQINLSDNSYQDL